MKFKDVIDQCIPHCHCSGYRCCN